MPEGLITNAIGGFYEINSEGEVFVCKARGAFRHFNITPLPGDRVIFEKQKEGFARLTDVLPRKNVLVRPAVANIDTLFITVSGGVPPVDTLLVDKLIFACVSSDIKPVIVINKSDMSVEDNINNLLLEYKWFSPYLLSAVCGNGIDDLKTEIHGKVCCFAGQSGVGKSSLMNAILERADIKTGALSRKTDHGKHTTRDTRIFFCDGGILMDTPGFSMYEPESYRADLLQDVYPEFKSAGACRFAGCSHINEPGCEVKRLVANGGIMRGRYERYKQLFEEFEYRRKHRYD